MLLDPEQSRPWNTTVCWWTSVSLIFPLCPAQLILAGQCCFLNVWLWVEVKVVCLFEILLQMATCRDWRDEELKEEECKVASFKDEVKHVLKWTLHRMQSSEFHLIFYNNFHNKRKYDEGNLEKNHLHNKDRRHRLRVAQRIHFSINSNEIFTFQRLLTITRIPL